MYSNLIVLMFLAGGLQTFLIVALCVSFIFALVIIWINWYRDYQDVHEEEDEKKLNKKWFRKCIFFLIPWGLILGFTCVIPDSQTILAYSALKAVDTYNVSHKDSNLTPDGIIATGDNVVKVINDAISAAQKALGHK